MKHKKLAVAGVAIAVASVISTVFFIYPFNVIVDEYYADASPAYSLTIYLVTPINRHIEPDNYLGKTLVYRETYWHQCANRNETSYYDGPCEFEQARYWVSNAAVGEEVAKLHYDNFANPYAGDPVVRILPLVIGAGIVIAACIGVFALRQSLNPKNENLKETQGANKPCKIE